MKTREELMARLEELKKDERIAEYPSADVWSNAPLALEQVAMGTRINTLEWALGLPMSNFPFRKKKGK